MKTISAEDVAKGLVDPILPIENRIDLALIADEFDDHSVQAALEVVARAEESELVPYACTALVTFWLRSGAPDPELFCALSYEGKQAITAALLHEAPQWLARL